MTAFHVPEFPVFGHAPKFTIINHIKPEIDQKEKCVTTGLLCDILSTELRKAYSRNNRMPFWDARNDDKDLYYNFCQPKEIEDIWENVRNTVNLFQNFGYFEFLNMVHYMLENDIYAINTTPYNVSQHRIPMSNWLKNLVIKYGDIRVDQGFTDFEQVLSTSERGRWKKVFFYKGDNFGFEMETPDIESYNKAYSIFREKFLREGTVDDCRKAWPGSVDVMIGVVNNSCDYSGMRKVLAESSTKKGADYASTYHDGCLVEFGKIIKALSEKCCD